MLDRLENLYKAMKETQQINIQKIEETGTKVIVHEEWNERNTYKRVNMIFKSLPV